MPSPPQNPSIKLPLLPPTMEEIEKRRVHPLHIQGQGLCMGLLDQLWDDTVAGPRPDSGLGKLRKYASFSPSSSSSTAAAATATAASAAAPAEAVPVTRSITILRPPALSVSSPRSESSSAPSSPASVPDSPFGAATTPKGESWKKQRRKARMADGTDAGAGTPRNPTVYDWVVISSLDR